MLTRSVSSGAWTIHLVLIICLKIFYDIIPGVSQETSWTLTNITYMFGSYIMFHYVRGVPFEFNGGAYDNLNMWEQIDDGAQYTPAKKFLLSVPIVLFLLSTHYTHYDLAYFTINFLAVLAVIIPKLPFVSQPPPLSLYLLWGRFLYPPIESPHACRTVFGCARRVGTVYVKDLIQNNKMSACYQVQQRSFCQFGRSEHWSGWRSYCHCFYCGETCLSIEQKLRSFSFNWSEVRC